MARLQQKKQAAVTTGKARTSGIPCAMLYGLYVRSPESGLVSLRRLVEIGTTRLDPSVGGPGLHDFAVRQDAFVHATSALDIPPSTASRPQRS
jgi:hypothetical protein